MLILKEDRSYNNIPMKNAIVRLVGCRGVYQSLPWEEYEMITKTRTVTVDKPYTEKEIQKAERDEVKLEPRTEEKEEEYTERGALLRSEKRFAVTVDLDFFDETDTGRYWSEQITLDGFKLDEWTFENIYKRLKELPKFADAKDA